MRPVHHLAALLVTAFACAGASAAVVTSTNRTYGFADGSQITRALNVTARGTIQDVNITVEFSKCDDPPIGPAGTRCLGVGDPYEDEFELALTGPNGERVDLVQVFSTYDGGGQGAGRVTVNFDDEASSAAGPRIQAGSFRPEQALSLFDSMDLFGSWTLYLKDFGRGDPLEFFSASLDITYEPAPVPEPATLAMLGLGLGLMGIRAAKRR